MRGTRAFVAVLAVCLGFVPASAPAQPRASNCPQVEPAISMFATSAELAVAIADVTSDGRNDLLNTVGDDPDEPFGNSLLVFEQHGKGEFEAPRIIPTDRQAPGVRGTMGIATGDFDADTSTDIAVATGAGVDVFFGAEHHDQKHVVDMPPASFVATGDFEGDGGDDLAVSTDQDVRVIRFHAGGSFETETVSTDIAWDLASGDVNGDGSDDVVYPIENELVVLTRRDGGGFDRTTYPLDEHGGSSARIAIGDLTRDDRSDVALVGGSMYVLFAQKADGALEPSPGAAGRIEGGDIAIVDWDRDHDNDLVSAPQGKWEVSAYDRGRVRALPCRYEMTLITPSRDEIAVGDLNGDARPDVVTKGTVILLQRAAPIHLERVVVIRRPTRSSLLVFGGALDLTGNGYHLGCQSKFVVQRFSNGRWRRFLGPKDVPNAHRFRIKPKAGALRAILQRVRPEPGYRVTCPPAVSNLAGSLDEQSRAGCPSVASSSATTLPWTAHDSASGDFNGDGRTDVAVGGTAADSETPGEVRVYFGTEDGRVADPVSLSGGEGRGNDASVLTGDFDGNGSDDLAVNASDLRIYYQSGGALSEHRVVTTEPPHDLHAGDVNGDGVDDLVGFDINGSHVWYGPGFDAPKQIRAFGPVIGDANGDGRPDIADSNWIGYQVADGSFIRMGLRAPSRLTVEATGDLNGDGLVDLVLGDGRQAMIRYARGPHAFGLPQRLSDPSDPLVTAIGDVAGNGRPDIVRGEWFGAMTLFTQTDKEEFAPACRLRSPGGPNGPHVEAIDVVHLAGVRGTTVVLAVGRRLLLQRVRT